MKKQIKKFQGNFPTLQGAWESSQKGEDMIRVAAKLGVSDNLLILTNVKIARTVEHRMTDESKTLLDITEKYANGEATEEELKEALEEYSPYNNASNAADYAAHYAAYNTAYHVAKASDDKTKNQLETADICREMLTDAVMELIYFND